MEIGIVMASLLDRDWKDALRTVAELGLTVVEPCSGGHVPKRHYDPITLASSASKRDEMIGPAKELGITFSSLGCYGNPLHPDEDVSRAAKEDFVATIKASAAMGINRVTGIAGCPAGGPVDQVPNWIANSLFPTLWETAYRWQWEERVIPVWKELAAVAKDHGVTVCLEPMAGDVIYNLSTFQRLRESVGESVFCQVDPSHLWWQGIDVIEFIGELSGMIGFVHAKDVHFNNVNLRRNGLLPDCSYDDWNSRSWTMRAVGYGHSDLWWREFITALRKAGYDGCLAIELQEPYMTVNDGLRKSVEALRLAMPVEPAPSGNWFGAYDWKPGE